MQLKGELSSENEISRSKIDELQDQCQKLLRQNSSVLKSMATLEHDLDKGQRAMSCVANCDSHVTRYHHESHPHPDHLLSIHQLLAICRLLEMQDHLMQPVTCRMLMP